MSTASIMTLDARGKVVFDSSGPGCQGRTIRAGTTCGSPCAGSTARAVRRSDPHDPEASSVMYVAAPIVDGGRIIGALSVGKPNAGDGAGD